MPDARRRLPASIPGLVLLCLLVGCAPMQARQEPTVDPGGAPRWIACGVSGCRLRIPDGFEAVPANGGVQFRCDAGEAVLQALVSSGTPGAPGRSEVEALMAAARARLATAVRWDQAPQGPAGIEVEGLSGSLRTGASVLQEFEAPRVHLVTYRNPRTGSVLLLEAQAPAERWPALWPRLASVFAEVELTADF